MNRTSDQKREPEAPAELESQFILRLPPEPSKILRELIQSGANNLKDRLSIRIENDMRTGEVRLDHMLLHAKVVDFPTIIESLKTIDNKTFYKTADICQMLLCKEDDDQTTTTDEELPSKAKKKDPNRVDKKYLYPHGLTPPMKNVRKRRFRKTLKKKYVEAPEIEKEVKRLLRVDNEAVNVKWEVINEDEDKSKMVMKEDAGNSNQAPAKTAKLETVPEVRNQQSVDVAEHDIFGSAVSDSEEETNINIMEMEDTSRLSADDSRLSDTVSLSMNQNINSSQPSLQQPQQQQQLVTQFSKDMFNDARNMKEESSSFDFEEMDVIKNDNFDFKTDSQYEENETMSKESIKERMEVLSKELSDLKTRRQQQEMEINNIENMALRQRLQDIIDNLLTEQLEKEHEDRSWLQIMDNCAGKDFIPLSQEPEDEKIQFLPIKFKRGLKRKKSLNPTAPKNALSKLNEMYKGLVFETVSQEGPVHAPMFTVAVKIRDKVFQGRGKSKKIAKHNAAEAALRNLIENNDPNFIRETIHFYGTNEETDFTSDITYKEVNTFEPGSDQDAITDGNANGLHEIQKTLGPKVSLRPVNKSPVMLLNELHPNIKYDITVNQNFDHNGFVTNITINDQKFEGSGPSKKSSKAAAARSALAALHNISYSLPHLSMKVNGPPSISSDVPQIFADHISKTVIETFTRVMKNNATHAKRKVLAGIVLSKGYDLHSCKVISVSTGSKCISGEHLSTHGTVVNDSHAEIISRRCFVKYLYNELSKHLSLEHNKETILERVPGGQGFRVKEEYLFHLFINTAPCGDSRIFSPHDEQLIDKHPNRKARGQLRTKIECGEGTIPVKIGEYLQTWDGILQGERLLTMSCSDKLAKWNVVGIQGALLSMFVEPIYFDSIILGSLFHPDHLSRALYGRIEKVLQALPPPYRLNKPKMALISSREERKVGRLPNFSVNWTIGDADPEVLSSITGKTEQNEVSRLAKCKMFEKFVALIGNIPCSAVFGIQDCSKSYRECKEKAHLYQASKKQLYEAFQKANLGFWIKKPFEAEEFECRLPGGK